MRALDRVRKAPPLDPGDVEDFTRDYVRHGAPTLSAALQADADEVSADGTASA